MRSGVSAAAAPPRPTAPRSICPARPTSARARAGSSPASTRSPCSCSGPAAASRTPPPIPPPGLRPGAPCTPPPPDPPPWAASWFAAGAGRTRANKGEDLKIDPMAALRRAAQRESKVGAGLAELDRWLCDQVRQGLAGSQQAGYRHWDDIAARMVDAQAPGLAERLRGLAMVPHSGAGWDGRLLEEYALLRLLILAYGEQADLTPPLRDTVRSRIGFTVRQADVLASGEHVRDRWQVLARRDLDQDRLRSRRTWLRGRTSGRYALVLSFAVAGQSLDDSLTVGTKADADLVFYPA